MALQLHTSIGRQAKDWGTAVENTVATADGAVTTGQGKNVSGHFVQAAEATNYVNQLNSFDVADTNGTEYRGEKPPDTPTLWAPVALMRYKPTFEAIVMSIDMQLPVALQRKTRRVRLQMFVHGPYRGLHRYVASVTNAERRGGASEAAGSAYTYDMANGIVDPISLYWRPPLFDANYRNGYYSFLRESALIRQQLETWNAAAAICFQVDVDQVMADRLAWQQIAVQHGCVYPIPARAPRRELNVPWQLAIVGRALDKGVVRPYPSI